MAISGSNGILEVFFPPEPPNLQSYKEIIHDANNLRATISKFSNTLIFKGSKKETREEIQNYFLTFLESQKEQLERNKSKTKKLLEDLERDIHKYSHVKFRGTDHDRKSFTGKLETVNSIWLASLIGGIIGIISGGLASFGVGYSAISGTVSGASSNYFKQIPEKKVSSYERDSAQLVVALEMLQKNAEKENAYCTKVLKDLDMDINEPNRDRSKTIESALELQRTSADTQSKIVNTTIDESTLFRSEGDVRKRGANNENV